jgi:putative ABC transport system permease protein
MVLAGGLRLASIGALIGLAGVLTLGRLMHSTLYGVHNFDVASTALVVLVLMSVAALACWIPARRSARVDPIIALREN